MYMPDDKPSKRLCLSKPIDSFAFRYNALAASGLQDE
jgi:hypothetical protein